MAIQGDRSIATYEGHTIELVRNNLSKVLRLLIDNREVAKKSCILPRRMTLTGTLEHDGSPHTIVARSIPRRLLWTVDTIQVDGKELPLTTVKWW